MRRSTLLTLTVLLLLSAPAVAELCTIDAVPAATLLLPYFEVDLGGSGINTFFSINNASAAPTVAHVTLWGDWEKPTISFDVFLTGYDVETLSLRDMFVYGNLPITAHATNDPTDVISPHGGSVSDNPDWDSSPDNPTNPLFPFCDLSLPIRDGVNPVLVPYDYLGRIQRGHTGQPMDIPDTCVAHPYGDNIARGFITIDNVTDCNLFFPNDTGAGYFGGVVSNINQLWGDYFIVDDGANFAHGDSLVHIEADPNGTAFVAGDYTFYGKHVLGLATDQREPLAATWGARYLNGGPFDGGTDLMTWRDSKCQNSAVSYVCGDPASVTDAGPPWYPLDETQIVSFDLAEQAADLCGHIPAVPPDFGINPPNPGTPPIPLQCFTLGAQRLAVGERYLDPPFDFGWLFLNLNHTLGDTSLDPNACTTDGLFGDISQSWVSVNMKAFASELTVGYAGTQLTNACNLPSICDLDGNICSTDLECDALPNTNLDGDFCRGNANQIIMGDLPEYAGDS